MFQSWIDQMGYRIGLSPNRFTAVEFRQRQREKIRRGSIYIKWIMIAVITIQVVGFLFLPPTPIDHVLVVVYAVLVLLFLSAFRVQGRALDMWIDLHEMTREQHQAETRRIHDLLFAQARNEDLFETIDSIPEGWLFSFGMMNREPQGVGPTAFLWKPDVYLKNGKVESRAVMGQGDTLVAALQDGIAKARVWID